MRTLAKLLLVVCLGVAVLPAKAMDSRPCSDPAVFPDAAVNALVLPYRAADGPDQAPPLQSASRQVSALVHLQLLTGMLKYGSIGAVDLIANSARERCDVDDVLFTVSRSGGGGSGGATLRPGRAVLVLWGRWFEQGGELYLQSY